MKTLIFVTGVLAAALSASAQTRPSGGQGYLFVAPGVETQQFPRPAALHLGGGGEWFVYHRFGLGAEMGIVGPWTDYTNWRTGYTLALGSANLSYHFLPETGDGDIEPFITAGYAIRIRAGTFHGANVGVGLNAWFREHVGLRLEIRNSHTREFHHFGFRVGVAFR